MAKTLMLIPTGPGVGLITVTMGIKRAFDHHGLRAELFRPIEQKPGQSDKQEEKTVGPFSLSAHFVEKKLSQGREDVIIDEVTEKHYKLTEDNEVIVIQGLFSSQNFPYASDLNYSISRALDAEIIFVASPGVQNPNEVLNKIEITARHYGSPDNSRILGCIINKINNPVDSEGFTRFDLIGEEMGSTEKEMTQSLLEQYQNLQSPLISVLGTIPWDRSLIEPRVIDIKRFLNAEVLCDAEVSERRVNHVKLCARTVPNMLNALQPGNLVITASDRADIVIATSLAALGGTQIAGLLLTGDFDLPQSVWTLCQPAIDQGFPILKVESDSFRTTSRLQNLSTAVAADDYERLEKVREFVASHIRHDWIQSFMEHKTVPRLTPAAFRHQLLNKARNAQKTIVLPEGEEPRVIEAAVACSQREIARCLLLGDREKITKTAANHGIDIPDNVTVIEPGSVYQSYVQDLVQSRQHKGMTEPLAQESLQDPVILATMMLYKGEVEGLVSGAVHTTADTIRPALRLIKTAENSQIVSSVFFMCLPEQVLVYGDCAVNRDPDAQQLADIAIQSADSAKTFGIEPKVAMISYSTGSSGEGVDVDKVKEATNIVKERRPDILVDGPLQYDAALIAGVARKKAPDSPVAGQATVFIFPDLNTGNTTYKAVQRSTGALSIGPMLQGLRKPVNDLSRGATVEDIIFTIALTAIQGTQTK